MDRFIQLTLSLALALVLLGCGSSEETYEAIQLPSHIKSAVMHIKDGKGRLQIEYQERTFVADGKIEEATVPQSFSLVRDSEDDQFFRYDFVWSLPINAWICPQCIAPLAPGFSGDSSIAWVKK